MYTLDRLLEEVAKQRGPLSARGGGDYEQVWDAFNRYVTAAIEKRQTLSVLNFCKIGWKLEDHMHGKVKRRPHFQVAENYARAHNIDVRPQAQVPDKQLATAEEFNFSKAAIRFSQNLTKDNIFIGLRAILQHLGEVISTGQQVSIDFEVGKLVAAERDVKFVFAAELYLQEGLEVPAGATEAEYRPSATFAPPTKDALSLSVSGTQAGRSVKATDLGGWEDRGPEDEERWEEASEAGRTDSTYAPASSRSAASAASRGQREGLPQSRSGVSAAEHVQREALDRHLKQMGAEAAAAMADRDLWEGHLQRCAQEEMLGAEWRRALNKEHSLHLQSQMRQAEERRVEGRQHRIEQASQHSFPDFTESPEQAVYEHIRERRTHLKEDLDQQVETKRLKQIAEKHRDREIDVTNIEANQRELALMKLETAAKKQSDRSSLHQAWEQDRHMHTARKAIRDHHKAPVRTDLPAVVQAAEAHAGLQMGGLPTPRGSAGPASRPVTGSVRRMPLGAAASLALHREKLASSRRH